MASNNPDASADLSQETPKNTRVSSRGSAAAIAPQTPSIGARKTEATTPPHLFTAFEVASEEEVVVGNPKLVFSCKQEGVLGVFFDGEDSVVDPTPIIINGNNMRNAVIATLTTVLTRALKDFGVTSVHTMALETAATLANGVMIATFLKLRSVGYLNSSLMSRFYVVPRTPQPFELPLPYALAISQLGAVKTHGSPQEGYYCPTIPATTSNFLLPAGISWNPPTYSRAVEYAKSLGLKFTQPDLDVQMASTWWLYRPVLTGLHFCLECPLPEENFTLNTAVLRTLFCNDATGGFMVNLFDLTPVGTDTYGSMLRNPQYEVDVTTYYAIEDAGVNLYSLG